MPLKSSRSPCTGTKGANKLLRRILFVNKIVFCAQFGVALALVAHLTPQLAKCKPFHLHASIQSERIPCMMVLLIHKRQCSDPILHARHDSRRSVAFVLRGNFKEEGKTVNSLKIPRWQRICSKEKLFVNFFFDAQLCCPLFLFHHRFYLPKEELPRRNRCPLCCLSFVDAVHP